MVFVPDALVKPVTALDRIVGVAMTSAFHKALIGCLQQSEKKIAPFLIAAVEWLSSVR